jgi:hypothetical protein
MTLLFDDSGDCFASGASGYRLTGGSQPTHLTIEVLVAGILAEAIVDTGAPYLICSPSLAERLRLDVGDALDYFEILIRGSLVKGGLHRVELTFLAYEGNGLSIEATAFVPDLTQNFGAAHPSFIGYLGCLERVRLAIDPSKETFYFGPLP